MRNQVTKQDVVDLLNEMFELDPAATNALVSNRAVCNGALADHPTIQVTMEHDQVSRDINGELFQKEPIYRVGLLGVLNGLFGVGEDGIGCIALITCEGKLLGFTTIKPEDDDDDV